MTGSKRKAASLVEDGGTGGGGKRTFPLWVPCLLQPHPETASASTAWEAPQDPHHHHHRFTATAPSPGPRTAEHRASSWAQLPRKLAKRGQERQERWQEKWGVKGPVPARHLLSPQGLDGMTTVPTKQPRACPLPSLSGNFLRCHHPRCLIEADTLKHENRTSRCNRVEATTQGH